MKKAGKGVEWESLLQVKYWRFSSTTNVFKMCFRVSFVWSPVILIFRHRNAEHFTSRVEGKHFCFPIALRLSLRQHTWVRGSFLWGENMVISSCMAHKAWIINVTCGFSQFPPSSKPPSGSAAPLTLTSAILGYFFTRNCCLFVCLCQNENNRT